MKPQKPQIEPWNDDARLYSDGRNEELPNQCGPSNGRVAWVFFLGTKGCFTGTNAWCATTWFGGFMTTSTGHMTKELAQKEADRRLRCDGVKLPEDGDSVEEMRRVLSRLVFTYVQNMKQDYPFVSCITPNGVPDYWLDAVRLIHGEETAKGIQRRLLKKRAAL